MPPIELFMVLCIAYRYDSGTNSVNLCWDLYNTAVIIYLCYLFWGNDIPIVGWIKFHFSYIDNVIYLLSTLQKTWQNGEMSDSVSLEQRHGLSIEADEGASDDLVTESPVEEVMSESLVEVVKDMTESAEKLAVQTEHALLDIEK